MSDTPRHGYSIGAASFSAADLAPGLHLVATPIGNLGDMTVRGLATLAAADLLLCEDTRMTGRLLERYGIRVAMAPYHEHNAQKVRPGIIERLKDGAAIALVSDAGMPLISDPGFRLVEACISNGIAVTAVPGASAALTGLVLSGLPTDRFTFIGFLPHKRGDRLRLLEAFQSTPATLIAYESPHRLADALEDCATVFPDRQVAVARELTKLHEEVVRGPALEVHAAFAARDEIRGEICLVIGPPAPAEDTVSDEEIEAMISAALEHLPASKAAAEVAKKAGLAKQEIYDRILKRRPADGR
jgi:16S rRNA (cytidine1402-2'-O)-methyltransferase